jgi:pimeloyl-ACP methyl ester carboxylesterase
MRPGSAAHSEMGALAELALEELGGFPGAIREMHLGIAGRAFRGVGPAAAPVKAIHDGISTRAYGALAAGTGLLARAAGRAVDQSGWGERVRLSGSPGGSAVIGALNGLIGDRLERRSSPLHQEASLRLDGEPLPVEPSALRRAFPSAGERVAVFVHGLMGTERYWWLGARERDAYGARLERDLGLSPLYLRYNSGRHISENGRSLAALLEALVGAWPVPLHEIDLIGHSMGGLVARSACHYGAQRSMRWIQLVGHVVSLGTPHLGAPLEQGAHVAAAALSKLPETHMLGALLRRRSAGIRDLRGGSLVDEDWQGVDPDALRAAACREVPLLPGATHCFVSATITASPRHPMGRLLGDMLVLVPSASGRSRTRRIGFAEENGQHVGTTHHLALLNQPAVYERLRGWLAQPVRA